MGLELRDGKYICSPDFTQETQFGAPHARDSTRSEQASGRDGARSGGRPTTERPSSAVYVLPSGPFSRLGPARANLDLAGDGCSSLEHDLAADRLGQHIAASVERGGFSLDRAGPSLRASPLPTLAGFSRRCVSRCLPHAGADVAPTRSGTPASVVARTGLGPGALQRRS